MELALERDLSELDPLFAGMRQAAPWPAGAWISDGSRTGERKWRSGKSRRETEGSAPATLEGTQPPPDGQATGAAAPDGSVASVARPVPGEVEVAATPPAKALGPGPAPSGWAGAEIAAGRSFIDAGDPMMAALHFGVAIRIAPESSAAVLEALGDRRDLPLQLVRGDALRLLGHEIDARDAYASLASALGAAESAAPGPTAGPGGVRGGRPRCRPSAGAPAQPAAQASVGLLGP